MTKHKTAIIFLSVINLMNLASGVITQMKMIMGSDVSSIIPITVPMTVNQVLLVNFMAVSILMTLISIVTTYLVTDVPYSPKEILSNCAGIFMIIPLLVLGASVFNAVNAAETVDKISIIVTALLFVLMNVINFGCVLTINEDKEG
ncbi:MAG: hypothetical protein ACI4IR_06445 [Eubacterium sp.]